MNVKNVTKNCLIVVKWNLNGFLMKMKNVNETVNLFLTTFYGMLVV